ncbi:site-specific recombinase XerD [Dysgonomonas hofstadii]|uniref:Site-specific recombinase XerD n=1 Tax=Dysgonomonas hofstadii TaxID=637886 RepID=A0A840CFN4_9BACT|nr:site-specific integrase [Dysgonomonas hofstadii]MBB4034780.1 site-specific recombinase XerD [Dysgonomonas hofstadii]
MKVEKFKVLLYLKKSGLDKSGKAPIMGRITLNNSMSQFSCKLSCTLSLWNPRESRLDGKSREAIETNQKIEKLLLAVHSAFDSLMKRKKFFDAESVKNLYQGSMGTQMTLLALLDRHMEELKARVGVDVAPTTLATYKYTHRSLGKFIKKKFRTKDVAFGQLNEQFIREYQNFVLLEQGYAMESVRHYLAILKKICKIAFKEGISEKLHFAHYKLPKQKETTPKALSRESFEKIRDLAIDPNRHSHLLTRDLFLFACYTGTSYADVVRITNENLFTDEEGSLWLKYRRKKTDFQARVKLLPEAIALLDKYRDENRESLFPIQSAEVVQLNMRGLRIMADIKQPISYHSGRHSFASLITLEEGVPIETISRMLGHSNIRTTQVYARVTPKKLFDDMDKFIEATTDLKLVL